MTLEHDSSRPKHGNSHRTPAKSRPADSFKSKMNGALTQRPTWIAKSPQHLEFVFFDLETTGGNPSNSEVIEIAAIKERDGKEIGRFQSLINPRRHIPRPVREITGIEPAMVKDAPVIEDVIDDLLAFIGDSILVSHGVLNDVSFVAHYARKLRAIELPNFYVCTHLLVSNFLPNIPVKSLSGVANYFSLPVGHAHRAMADAEMTRSIFWEIQKICAKNGFKSLEDLLKIQADNQTLNRLGPGLLSQDVDKAPTTPGLLYLFNSSREVTYMSATPNIRRSLMNVTELSDERDFNRLLVDVTDFKFERSAHFLASLLQEKKELKKLELAVDPRKFQGRAENTLQVLLPDDLIAFWKSNPSALPFSPPGRTQRVLSKGLLLTSGTESSTHADISEENLSSNQLGLSDQERNQYVYAHLAHSGRDTLRVPIRKTRRLVNAVKNPKYKVSRVADSKRSAVHMGHLVAGTGWFFGPLEQPKIVRRRLDELLTVWPFHDTTLPLEERAEMATHFIQVLLGRYDDEIQRLVSLKNSVKNIFNPLKRKQFNQTIDLIKAFRTEGFALPASARPKTGLAVLTNTDTKDLDIVIVVRGRIRRQLKLPIEDSDKLRSTRFFTRLMLSFHDELFRPDDCLEFNEDVCNELELFAHWFNARRGEGEWVDFETLSPLYNPNAAE